MVELTPEEERYYSTASMAVLFDLAVEITTRLSGKCLALADAAATEKESEEWIQRTQEFHQAREALDPDDRDAVIAYIIRGRSELDRLRNEQA